MKSWKQPTLLSRNSSDLNAALLILETNKQEDEDYLFYFYKTNDTSSKISDIKNILLASSSISTSLFYDDYRILSFTYNNISYKSTSKLYLNNYLICVIVPSITPDNIVLFICNEFISFCNLFFENFEESKKFTNILNKYTEILFYLTSNYMLTPSKEDIIGTPISLLPLMNITFSYNEILPTFMIKPGISDCLRTEIIEHLITLNRDRSVLQETLTLMEPPFYLKGYILLYRGFVVFNTLNNKEMANGARLALLHEMYMRSQSSPEILSCEFLFDTPPKQVLNITNQQQHKKKTLTTLLAQREFVMLINLEILGKNNCSFDPFYHKRAEDLLVNLLGKSFSSLISKELTYNSIKMSNVDEFNKDELGNNNEEREHSIKEVKEIETVMSNKSQQSKSSIVDVNRDSSSKESNKYNNSNKEYLLQKMNNKIKGYVDSETNVNIIHFSCYDDAECVINTTDLNVTTKMFKEIYRYIFNIYAEIQSNINKIKLRNKKIKLNQIFSNSNIHKDNVLRKDIDLKKRIEHEHYIKAINTKNKMFKINEYGVCLPNNTLDIPVWICCKIYEHITIDDDITLDEYSNYKIIFVAYESQVPVETDSFCQDLLMNELFI